MILVSLSIFGVGFCTNAGVNRILFAKCTVTWDVIDAINRLQRPGGLEDQSAAGQHMMHDMRSGAAFAARKFYAQRNL